MCYLSFFSIKKENCLIEIQTYLWICVFQVRQKIIFTFSSFSHAESIESNIENTEQLNVFDVSMI